MPLLLLLPSLISPTNCLVLLRGGGGGSIGGVEANIKANTNAGTRGIEFRVGRQRMYRR
jgi:hypothetical protein